MSNIFGGSGGCAHHAPLIFHVVMTGNNESTISSLESMIHCDIVSTAIVSGSDPHRIYSKFHLEVVPELLSK